MPRTWSRVSHVPYRADDGVDAASSASVRRASPPGCLVSAKTKRTVDVDGGVPAMAHWCCSQGGGNDPAAPQPSRPARYVAAPTPCHTSSSMTTNLSAMAPGALSRHERHSAMVLAVSQLLQQARAEISDCKNKDVGSIATGATGSGELSQCTAILHHDLVRWHGLNGTGRCYDQARGMLSL